MLVALVERILKAIALHDKEIERLLDGLCLRAEKKRLPSRWWPVLSDPEELAAKEGYSVTVISHRLQPKRNRVG